MSEVTEIQEDLQNLKKQLVAVQFWLRVSSIKNKTTKKEAIIKQCKNCKNELEIADLNIYESYTVEELKKEKSQLQEKELLLLELLTRKSTSETADNNALKASFNAKSTTVAVPAADYREFFDAPGLSDSARVLHDKVLWLWANRATTKLCFSVVNSTGNGKTFACLQLCTMMRGVYCLCAQHGGLHSPSKQIAMLVKAIDQAGDLASKNAIAIAFASKLRKVMKNKTSAELHKEQFNDMHYMGISSLLTEDDMAVIVTTTPTKLSPPSFERLTTVVSVEEMDTIKRNLQRVSFADAIDGADVDVAIDATADAKVDANDEPLVVIFDEADGLMGNLSIANETCSLRCIQRAFDLCGVVTAYLCTSSRLEEIQTSQSSSRLNSSKKINSQPVIEVIEHDIFHDHPFHLGRPLWYQCFRYHCCNDYNQLVKFVQSKLVNDKAFELSACALFCCRLGFEPTTQLCSTFVANNLAVMTQLSAGNAGEEHIGTCRWFSEPVIAEAAAALSSGIDGISKEKYDLKKILREVETAVGHRQLIKPSVGDKGEVVAAALVMYTLDCLRSQHLQCTTGYNANHLDLSMSCAVSVIQFLKAMGITAPEKLSCILEGYVVNCTHFQRHHVQLTETNCIQAVLRRMGFYVYAGADSVDLVIVAYKVTMSNDLADAIFIPVRIQVKNKVSKITAAAASVLLANMSPAKNCQPILTSSEVEVGIVIATGTGGADVVECVVQPAENTKTRRQPQKAYYGFLLDIKNSGHFSTLREFDAPDPTQGVMSSLNRIAQCHLSADENPCFTKGFLKHEEVVRKIFFILMIFSFFKTTNPFFIVCVLGDGRVNKGNTDEAVG